MKKAALLSQRRFVRRWGLWTGTSLICQVIDGELRVATMRERIRRAQERVRHLVPPGTLVSDELSAERREAARTNDGRMGVNSFIGSAPFSMVVSVKMRDSGIWKLWISSPDAEVGEKGRLVFRQQCERRSRSDRALR